MIDCLSLGLLVLLYGILYGSWWSVTFFSCGLTSLVEIVTVQYTSVVVVYTAAIIFSLCLYKVPSFYSFCFSCLPFLVLSCLVSFFSYCWISAARFSRFYTLVTTTTLSLSLSHTYIDTVEEEGVCDIVLLSLLQQPSMIVRGKNSLFSHNYHCISLSSLLLATSYDDHCYCFMLESRLLNQWS